MIRFRVHEDLREVLHKTRSVEDCRKLVEMLNERIAQESVVVEEQIQEAMTENKQNLAEEL